MPKITLLILTLFATNLFSQEKNQFTPQPLHHFTQFKVEQKSTHTLNIIKHFVKGSLWCSLGKFTMAIANFIEISISFFKSPEWILPGEGEYVIRKKHSSLITNTISSVLIIPAAYFFSKGWGNFKHTYTLIKARWNGQEFIEIFTDFDY